MVLHGFEERLLSEPRVFAAAGHRCAATVSSSGQGLCVRVDARQLLVYVGEERNRHPRVSFACGPEVP